MDINQETVGDVAIIEVLADTIDLSNSGDVKDRLAVVAATHRKAVVDLSRVRYMDSSGCGALVASLSRFRTAGGDLRLCNPTPEVRSLLELVRLTRVLTLHDTRDDALAAFAAG